MTIPLDSRLPSMALDSGQSLAGVKEKGLRVVVVFEGRDAAGKGGVIKRITERVSPRVFRVVALAAPSEREKTQMYMQRCIPHFPAAGEVVLFDRSWYNRAGVERVMKFCTKSAPKRNMSDSLCTRRSSRRLWSIRAYSSSSTGSTSAWRSRNAAFRPGSTTRERFGS